MTHPYASEAYSTALAEDSECVRLSDLNTWAILRPIPGTSHVDAVGPYPFSPLQNPPPNSDAFSALRDSGAVSVTFVTDALRMDTEWLSDCFDLARPYKRHYIVDRRTGGPSPSNHHRYEVKRALAKCQARRISLAEHLDEWIGLYDVLVRRRGLTGVHAFPRSYFERLSTLAELVTVGAFADERLVSCHLWIISGEVAYSHLAASNEDGYARGAAYAVYDHAFSILSTCEVIDLGGVPDNASAARDGLARLKRGFANRECHNWICGKVLRKDVYETLCAESENGAYFPAYRASGR